MRNRDVLRMHRSGLSADEIVSRIQDSSCNFDIFPPVLRDLRKRGIPDAVLATMAAAPYGPPVSNAVSTQKVVRATLKVRVPTGTKVELETSNPISSAEVAAGSRLNFQVTRQVAVSNVLVIARNAVARGRVIHSRRGGAWGRAGSLEWLIEDVQAVDGSWIPLKLESEEKGTSHTTAVAAAAIATGALVFPYSAPVALVWWLKKGDDAVLDRTRKPVAAVLSNTDVAGFLPEKRRTIYHSVEKLKTADASTSPRPAFNNSFKPTPIRQ